MSDACLAMGFTDVLTRMNSKSRTVALTRGDPDDSGLTMSPRRQDRDDRNRDDDRSETDSSSSTGNGSSSSSSSNDDGIDHDVAFVAPVTAAAASKGIGATATDINTSEAADWKASRSGPVPRPVPADHDVRIDNGSLHSYDTVLTMPLVSCRPKFDADDPTKTHWMLSSKNPDMINTLRAFSGSVVGVLGQFNKVNFLHISKLLL